jgi:glycosyltransferase involved in cell wall biosynthesis
VVLPHVTLLRDVPEERRYSMERYADELEQRLRASGRFAVEGFAIHQRPVAARVGLGLLDGYWARFLHYPLAAARRQADLYHVIDQGYGHVAALLPARRTVVTCHDLFLLVAAERFPRLRGRPTSVVRFRWTTSFLRRVAHVICVSETSRADAIRICRVAPVRTTVIRNGINERFRPLDGGARRVREEVAGKARFAILHVSSGVSYKNVRATIAVLAALRSDGLDAVLVRAGAPLNPQEQAHAVAVGVGGAVAECGRISDERLVELYNACDVLLFPSYYEGFGWPPLEAMACGLPVVTSTVPAIMEVVGDAALTADPDDVATLAAHVRAVFEREQLAADLRNRGLKRAAGFSWSRAIAAYEQVYDQVLACAA